MVDDREIAALVGIAVRAGAAILAVDRRSANARPKADGSPVTEADLAANRVIVEGLRDAFPGVPTISEESPQPADFATARHVFLIDPLDGTREFLRGVEEFTVNIALLDGADPVAGVVYAPASKSVYFGALDLGARRATVANGALAEAQRIAAVTPPARLRVVTSHSHYTSNTQSFIGRYSVERVVPIGSSLKFCLIAAGEADLYPRMGTTMEWDTAAGQAVLCAAGGSVRTLDGKPLQYRKAACEGRRALENPWFVAAGAFDPLT